MDNTKRKRWQLENIDFDTETVYWIEGIGSTFGLYMSSCTYTHMHGHQYDLLCYYEDNIHLYQRPMWNTCSYFSTSNVEEYGEKEVDFTVYPNPASDNFSIQLQGEYNPAVLHYKLMDMTGKIIQQGDALQTFSVSGVKSGVYFVRLEGDGKLLGVRKVVFNR